MIMSKFRTDNVIKFIDNKFEGTCDSLEMEYQRIPVKTPDMNTHIESFHPILEEEYNSCNELKCHLEVYAIASEYMNDYN